MTNYSHTQFTATNSKAFRAGLIKAIHADLAIDAAEGHELNLIEDGKVRHGIFVNGRHIGYEATIDQAGNLRVTDLQPLADRASRKPVTFRTIDELRQTVAANRVLASWLGK